MDNMLLKMLYQDYINFWDNFFKKYLIIINEKKYIRWWNDIRDK